MPLVQLVGGDGDGEFVDIPEHVDFYKRREFPEPSPVALAARGNREVSYKEEIYTRRWLCNGDVTFLALDSLTVPEACAILANPRPGPRPRGAEAYALEELYYDSFHQLMRSSKAFITPPAFAVGLTHWLRGRAPLAGGRDARAAYIRRWLVAEADRIAKEWRL